MPANKKFKPVIIETPQSQAAIRGRGASWSPANRFEKLHVDLTDIDVVQSYPEVGHPERSEAKSKDPAAVPSGSAAGFLDFARNDDAERPQRVTEYFRDGTRTIITRNTSPDVGFETSLNPYRGCEHGCIYCYARPTHEYLGFSAGLDFESKIMVKTNAPELLRANWNHRDGNRRRLC